MNGSYSIKYVPPALVPEFAKAYKELEVYKMEEGKKNRMRTTLIEYCKLDTLAMVKILKILEKFL